MLDKAKLLAQAFKINKALEAVVTTVEDGEVVVEVVSTLSGQKIKNLHIAGSENKKLVEVLNKALKKSQEQMAKTMQGMDIKLPGM